MPEKEMDHLRQSLDRMTQVLGSHMDLVNTCMVEFIVKDMFSLLPLPLRSELLSLSDDLLTSLPSLLYEESPGSEERMRLCPELMSVVSSLRGCRIKSLGIVSDEETDVDHEEKDINGLQHWDKIILRRN